MEVMEVSVSDSIDSAGITSGPKALPVFRRLIVLLASFLSGIANVTCMSYSAIDMSGELTGVYFKSDLSISSFDLIKC